MLVLQFQELRKRTSGSVVYTNLHTKPLNKTLQNIINGSDFLFWIWGFPIPSTIFLNFRPDTGIDKK